MKRCAASAAKVFGRGVGRTFLQKGFPTASDKIVPEKLPTGRRLLSTFKVDNISNFHSLWKFSGFFSFSLAVDRWKWGNLFGKSVSPHPFQKLFLRVLRTLRFISSLSYFLFSTGNSSFGCNENRNPSPDFTESFNPLGPAPFDTRTSSIFQPCRSGALNVSSV